jgi:hypothetical protein
MCAVAARSAGIQQVQMIADLDFCGELAHDLRGGGYLADGLLLDRKPVMIAAISVGDISPFMIWRMSDSISS